MVFLSFPTNKYYVNVNIFIYRSATYISCLIAVEAYWPEDAEKRSALKEQVASLDSSDIMQVSLLCYHFLTLTLICFCFFNK
jgi:hypothetical protein